MKAIDKAWEMNLKLNEDDRYETKEELISNLCIDGDFDFKIKAKTDDEGAIICKQFGKEGSNRCVKCFNCEILENSTQEVQTKDNIDNSELTFDKLKDCSVEDISLNELSEKDFKDLLINNSSLIYVSSGDGFTYENLPTIATYLLEVYDYATKLKNRVEYVDFTTAKEHMCRYNSIAECEGVLYDSSSKFTIEVIDSDKWILIKTQ